MSCGKPSATKFQVHVFSRVSSFDIVLFNYLHTLEELDDPAVSALGKRSRKLSKVREGQSSDGRPKCIISSSSVLRKAR
jgi:hypothetical protein